MRYDPGCTVSVRNSTSRPWATGAPEEYRPLQWLPSGESSVFQYHRLGMAAVPYTFHQPGLGSVMVSMVTPSVGQDTREKGTRRTPSFPSTPWIPTLGRVGMGCRPYGPGVTIPHQPAVGEGVTVGFRRVAIAAAGRPSGARADIAPTAPISASATSARRTASSFDLTLTVRSSPVFPLSLRPSAPTRPGRGAARTPVAGTPSRWSRRAVRPSCGGVSPPGTAATSRP